MLCDCFARCCLISSVLLNVYSYTHGLPMPPTFQLSFRNLLQQHLLEWWWSTCNRFSFALPWMLFGFGDRWSSTVLNSEVSVLSRVFHILVALYSSVCCWDLSSSGCHCVWCCCCSDRHQVICCRGTGCVCHGTSCVWHCRCCWDLCHCSCCRFVAAVVIGVELSLWLLEDNGSWVKNDAAKSLSVKQSGLYDHSPHA